MKTLHFSPIILTLLFACSCQDKKREKTLQAAELKKEVIVAAAEQSSFKPGKFLTVEEYYPTVRSKYLSLAGAQNESEFNDAFQKVLGLHVKKDITNFKMSCVYFYQQEKLITGINSDFDESNKPWVKSMGKDLHLILTNMLTLPPSETVDLAIRIFACRLEGGMYEEYVAADKAREFLNEFNEKLRISLK